MLVVDAKYQLNRDEVDFFVANGYLGPYAAMPPDAMAAIRREIEDKVLASDGPNPRSRGQSRHMDQPAIYDLATDPAIIERIACLLGPDLVVWATNLWLKNSGGVEIPWHQDINFWPPRAAGEYFRLDRGRRCHGRERLRQNHPRLPSGVAPAYQSGSGHGFRRDGGS